MDEHRIGLKPIRRSMWAPTGQPLTCPVAPGYEWLYVYAFVNPESGESLFWLIPVVNKQAYAAVMAAFAQ
ncbi:IS630 family transposase, partial [Deinococcus sp. ME38]